MAKAKFYTYVHRKASTGDVFYVGKGSGKRFAATQGRSSYWRSIVAKHGITIEVVAYFFDEAAAFDHERLLIAEYRSGGIKLCNLTDGGDGASGNVMSEDARQKISAARLGIKRGPDSEETRRKKSESAKGRPMSAAAIAKTVAFHTGRKRSLETIAKMSAALKGHGAGRIVSQETRQKLSENRKGQMTTAATRKKISLSHETRTVYSKMTDEKKRKILAGQAAYWQRKREEKAGLNPA